MTARISSCTVIPRFLASLSSCLYISSSKDWRNFFMSAISAFHRYKLRLSKYLNISMDIFGFAPCSAGGKDIKKKFIVCTVATSLIVASIASVLMLCNADTGVFVESWENGLNGWNDTPYHTAMPVIVDSWAHEGNKSLRLFRETVVTRDVVNSDPEGTAYVWAYCKCDPFILASGYGSIFESGFFEMRHTINHVIGFPEMRSTDYGNTFYWELDWFDMTWGHHFIGARNATNIQVLPDTEYFVVLGYDHTATHVSLKLWINQPTKGVPDATLEIDADFNYVANNLYAGCCKTQDGPVLSYKYIDDLGFGNSYPDGTAPSTTPQPTITPTPSATPTVTPEPSPQQTPPPVNNSWTIGKWEQFWAWLKTEQNSPHWAGYLEDMKTLYEEQNP